MGKLIIDGNQVYEIDEECMRQKKLIEENQAREKSQDKQQINCNDKRS